MSTHLHPPADPEAAKRQAADRLTIEAVNSIYRNSLEKWFLRFGYLKDKEGAVAMYPAIKLMDVQAKIFKHHDACLAAKKPCKQIILKPRRGGASTGVQAAMYFRGRKFSGREAAIMGDIAGTSSTVFEIYRRLAENDRLDWGDGRGNLRAGDKDHNQADDIELPNGSTYKKVTAGSTNANRSGGIQFANCTEVAYYPLNIDRDPLTSFLGSWNELGEFSYAAMDSTSNGPAGKFYDYYMNPANGWEKIFSAWHDEPTYRIKFDSVEQENQLKRDIDADREDTETMLRFGCDLEQMHWLITKLRTKCGGSREQLHKEFPSTVDEAFLSKSALRFNISVLENMERMAIQHPPNRGDFVTQEDGTVSFLPDAQGDTKIFEEPKVGCKYLGAFDPCAGEDQQQKGQSANPDFHSIGILRDEYIDATNGQVFPPKVVAHYHSRADAMVATEAAAAMSRHYGKCMFVVETNGVGLYPVKTLHQLGIPLWSRKQKSQTPGQVELAHGWFSSEQLRTTIIDTLGHFVGKWRLDSPTFECWDMDIIGELKKMVTRNGRDEAMPPAHDDTVIALSLMLYLRANATMLLEAKRPKQDLRKMLAAGGWKLQKRSTIIGG